MTQVEQATKQALSIERLRQLSPETIARLEQDATTLERSARVAETDATGDDVWFSRRIREQRSQGVAVKLETARRIANHHKAIERLCKEERGRLEIIASSIARMRENRSQGLESVHAKLRQAAGIRRIVSVWRKVQRL